MSILLAPEETSKRKKEEQQKQLLLQTLLQKEKEADLERFEKEKQIKIIKSRQKRKKELKVPVKNYTLDQIYCVAKENYGSIYNLLGLGGPGTYVLFGATEAGKTFCAKQLYFYAVSPLAKKERRIKFADCIIMSSTADINNEYTWNPNNVFFPKCDHSVDIFLNERIDEMKEACDKLGMPHTYAEEWAEEHPIFLVMDDWYGKIDFTTPGNSGSELATKARHYGVYFIINIQYKKQAGPVFWDNARMFICFGVNADGHKDLVDRYHGKNPELVRVVRNHNRVENNMVVYVRTWRFKRYFGVAASRVMLLYPIPAIDKDIKRVKGYLSRYSLDKESTSSESESNSEELEEEEEEYSQ